MSANTETTGADRAKCKAWCGVMWGFLPHKRDPYYTNEDVRPGSAHKFCWCSPACRDQRLPQFTNDAPPIAAPAAHVGMDMGVPGSERSVYRCSGCDWFIDTTCMSVAQVAELVNAHMHKDHSAAHVERRKGQRWAVTYEHFPKAGPAVIELTGIRAGGWSCRNVENSNFPGWIHDQHWEPGNPQRATMTLLADAPPEPAGRLACAHGATPGLCSHCKSPPAQEAPKAAPVGGSKKAEGFAIPLAAGQMWDRTEIGDVWTLTTPVRFGPYAGQWNAIDQRGEEGIIGPDDLTDVGAVLLGARPLRKELIAAPKLGPCDDCGDTDGVKWFQFDDMMRTFCEPCRTGAAAWMAAQTGAPYAGPERLPRPQLAADWVEDCLPEAGR